MKTTIKTALPLMLAASLFAAAPSAQAADWPDHAITFVAPFSAGGANDLVARIIAKAVGQELKQSVIVENRPGAGGVVGSAHVARSAPDGYTYLVGSNGTVTNSLIRSQPYKDEEITPVAMMSITPSVIVTSANNPAKDLKEFVANARAKKSDRVTFSTAGNGSTPHFVGIMMKMATGLPVEPIAYKSGSEGVTAVIGNQVDATSEASIVTLPLVKAGKLKALATTVSKRMASAPEIPTTKEEGFPDIAIGHWAGLYAPTGTPAAVMDKMNAAVNKALLTKEVQDSLAQSSIEPGSGTRAEFAAFAASERERLGKVVEAGQMKGD
jgi:tripartite-type tricarboxylate transporter receptor subunit TctC